MNLKSYGLKITVNGDSEERHYSSLTEFLRAVEYAKNELDKVKKANGQDAGKRLGFKLEASIQRGLLEQKIYTYTE